MENDEVSHPDGFRARLKSALGDNTDFSVPPRWGATPKLLRLWDLTNAARLSGADKLKAHILGLPKQEGQKHFLLAHSHGGNVAMYAMQDKEVQERIDGIICMATPFLFPRRRPLSITTLVLSLIIMIIGVVEFIWEMGLLNHGWLAWIGGIGVCIVAVVIPAFLTWVVAKTRYENHHGKQSLLAEHVEQLSFKDPDKPILLVRSSGDEASGLLRGTQFLNWMGGMVMRIGGKQIYPLICAIILAVLLMAHIGMTWIPEGTISLLNASLIILSAIMVVMLMALTLSRTLVGLDAWHWVGEIETMVEDGPPGIKSELVVITPRQPEGGLSHSAVFSEPETITAIANWCRSERHH